MSLAQDLSLFNHSVEGNVALPLPTPARAPRPGRKVAKGTKAWRLWVIGSMGWVLVMACFMLLVYRNSLVLGVAKSITETREQLILLEETNQQLEASLVKATSVSEVERWAVSHGMRRPATIKTLDGDPSALANRPAPLDATVESTVGGSASGVWQVVKGLMARVSSVVGLTASSR